ncbi:MAG: hypothetical protein SFV53_05730 [Rickettsiales bacterium]|nr:hypothetical protein [Rickettsiales bacterium]
MPQLDFTTYIPQIFWLALCFITLYLTTALVILPRISAILKKRQDIIDADLSKAKELDDKISALEIVADNLRQNANQAYQNKLDEASKSAIKMRETMIENLKNQIDSDIKKSQQELKNLIETSKQKGDLVVKNLVTQIANKLLSQ